MDAESREAVFSALRAKGIKAIKVVAADGSKANGEIRGVRKRMVAGIAVAAAVVAGAVAFFLGERGAPGVGRVPTENTAPRHQIYGDPVILADFERGNFDAAFTNRAHQMLAWFAQPGKLMCPKGVDPRRMAGEFAAAFGKASCDGIEIGADDLREVQELKQIVNGTYGELADYLANGNGNLRSFWRRLLERTQQEMQIYERTRRELENEKNATIWEQKNDALRRLGLRTIPNPKDAD